MTKYEQYQKEYLAALEMADHDIDGAISRLEGLIVAENQKLQFSKDATERLYHTDNIGLLQMDLTILKNEQQERMAKRARLREHAKSELEVLMQKLDILTRRKEIKVSRIAVKGPLKAVACAVAFALLIFFVCDYLQENGFVMQQVENPGFLRFVQQTGQAYGNWVNDQLMGLGINLSERLPFSGEIVTAMVCPLLSLVIAALVYAAAVFLCSVVKSLVLRAVRALRAHQEKTIRQKMRKLSQAAANA